jgi:hypothetical protein
MTTPSKRNPCSDRNPSNASILIEGLPFEVLHHQVGGLGLWVRIEYADDVPVLKTREDVDLPEQSGPIGFLGRPPKEFHSHAPLRTLPAGEENGPHAPDPEQTEWFVSFSKDRRERLQIQ